MDDTFQGHLTFWVSPLPSRTHLSCPTPQVASWACGLSRWWLGDLQLLQAAPAVLAWAQPPVAIAFLKD